MRESAAMATKKKVAAVDPLSAFSKSRNTPKVSGKRFASGEHTWLGNAGAQLAAQQLRKSGIGVDDETFLNVSRLSGDTHFEYGELVALSGDFYASPSELYEEVPATLPTPMRANDLKKLRELFAVELEWIGDRQHGRGGDAYPDTNVSAAWNAKSYVELALRNVDHFGWHNVVAYVRHHAVAMKLAASANGEDDERWQRALVYNAFADHFLTDGFAAGHLRVPRAEIIEWAATQNYSAKLAGILSKVLHDQDGHVTSLHGEHSKGEGLRVTNAKGADWLTFCDGQLFLFPGATDRDEVKQPVLAVAASLGELVRAWKTGELPERTYAALDFVPFPHPKELGLAEKFAKWPTARIDALVKSCAFYAKVPWLGAGLKREHVVALIKALPALMKRFGENVKNACEENAELQARIPKAYLKAYQSIR
ncbi:MAG: hypothetical protein DI536_32270 [Archangium gephyra]|uniref:Uncharacterized protein n=1 Tax=Archangium gephyra TaxID=48 RepID=A0A2W5V5N3_9BACT|nr:MAG: hypothetical protein DI536_32270 [Archangium gephyra]